MEAGREGANTYIIHAVIDYVKLIFTLNVALADVQGQICGSSLISSFLSLRLCEALALSECGHQPR